jgi:PAS domain S-box-containing protein
VGLNLDELAEVLLASSPDAAIMVGPDGIIELASPQVEGLFGYRPDELLGEPVEKLIPEDLRRAHVGHRRSYASALTARSMGSGLELFGRRKDGSTLPIDVSLAPVKVDSSDVVCAFVRDATERRRREDLLRFVNEIARVLLAEQDTANTLALTCRRALLLAEADASWVVLPRGNSLVVAAADGDGRDHVLGASLSPETSISGRVIAASAPMIIEDMSSHPDVAHEAQDLDLGPGMYLPMVSEQGSFGILVIARRRGARPFTRIDEQILSVFGSAASLVLILGETRRELEQLRFVADHERIARDLHDNVIQRLFAVGLSLQGLLPLMEGPVLDRVTSAVDAIDEVIREIRETIFELNRSSTQGVRAALRRMVTDVAGKLGLQPKVQFNGPVDSVVDEELTAHLLAVVREALSNAARHGKAQSVQVTLNVSQTSIALTVADDGRGFPATPSSGHGLSNMEARAQMLGGALRLSSSDGSGSLIEWQVPIPNSSQS